MLQSNSKVLSLPLVTKKKREGGGTTKSKNRIRNQKFLYYTEYILKYIFYFCVSILESISTLSLFKKLIGKLLNQPEEEKGDVVKLGDQLKNADLDYKFAQLFTHSGGFFNYCENEAEALKILNQILKIECINSVFCWDEDLKNFLNVLKVPHTPHLDSSNDAAFITCEYLIAYDGRIMLSHNNILHYHSSRLPEKIIIMANVSQIVTNLGDAMMRVKRRGALKNLTSISGSESKLDTPNKVNTKLFLLLLEG